jgi:NADPH:quinone reductase-like Zn-dependent oxidoreductase
MRAAVIYEHGNAPIQIDPAFADPVPAEGEVIVRVGASSLNYHDVFTRRGMPGIKVPMPVIMGLDLAGEIVAVGAGAGAEWKKGDRVLVDPIDRVGAGGLIGEMRHGGLAELCKVPVHQLVRLPDNVSFEAAACLPVAYGTALRMMYTIGNVQKGEKVLILGASGGVGTCCVQLAKMVGAEVIACASNEKKLAQLKELGADQLIDYKRQDFAKAIYELYGKPHRRKFEGGVDVAVNFTGGETWVPTLKVVHRRGRILTCGATAGFDPKEDLRYIWSFELQVLGSNGWMRDDLVKLLDLIGSGKLKPVIDKVLPLEHVNEAFRLLEDREVFGKVVLKP